MTKPTPTVPAAGEFGRALRGEQQFAVGEVLQYSWDITARALPSMLPVLALVLVVNTLLQTLLQSYFPVDFEQPNAANMLIQHAISMLFVAPLLGIVSYLGVYHARQQVVDQRLLQRIWLRAGALIGVASSQFVLTLLSALVIALLPLPNALKLTLLVLAACYWQLALTLAVPLLLDQQLYLSRALFASILVFHRAMAKMLALYVVLWVIIVISALPMLLGLIFTLPLLYIATGTLYHCLIGPPIARVEEA